MNAIEYIIKAKDMTASGVKSALAKIKELGAGFVKNAQNIRAAFGMLQTAARNAVSFLQKAFQFEKMTVQFKTLIGSMDEARAHMAMLQKMGDTPPFSLEEFAAASRTLMVMTENVLGFKDSLELIGDAAAATGQSIDSLAHHVGLAFASIRDGAPITRATFALRSMGAITPEVAEKLDELQKSGASTTEVWQTLEDHLKRFKGAMEDTEKTGDGLMGAIKSQWDDSLRTLGAAFMETAKDGLGGLLDKMKEINRDGTLYTWASKVSEMMTEAADAVKNLREQLKAVGEAEPIDMFDRSRSAGENMDHSVGQFFGNAWAQLGGIGAMIRGWVTPGENGLNNYLAYGALHGYGGFSDAAARKLNQRMRASGEWTEDTDIRAIEESRIAEIKAEGARKAAKAEADAKAETERKAAEEAKKKQEALAEGQRKIDEKNAKAKAEKEAEAAQKAAEAYAKEYEKWLRQEEQARIKMEQRISSERLKLRQKELAEAQNEESSAQSMLAEAQEKSRRAWGWYRDKDSLRAQLEEEKVEAAAQKQFDKDFDRLRRRRSDWRTADNLSLDDEAVRRVGLAREEERAAEEYARQTAENTRVAAKALEAIQAAIEEGGEA